MLDAERKASPFCAGFAQAMLAGFLRVGLGYVWIGQKNGVDS